MANFSFLLFIHLNSVYQTSIFMLHAINNEAHTNAKIKEFSWPT